MIHCDYCDVLFNLIFKLQSLGCDRPVNYKTEKLDEVLKKEFPVRAEK